MTYDIAGLTRFTLLTRKTLKIKISNDLRLWVNDEIYNFFF